MKEWTGLDFNGTQRPIEDRQRLRKSRPIVNVSNGVPATMVVPVSRFARVSGLRV